MKTPKAPVGPPFPRHCEAEFLWLAEHDPAGLVALLLSGALPPHLLTYAAEHAGGVVGSEQDAVVGALVGLLRHARAGVREGAIYGLQQQVERGRPELRAVIRLHTDPVYEPSPGVRLAAGARE